MSSPKMTTMFGFVSAACADVVASIASPRANAMRVSVVFIFGISFWKDHGPVVLHAHDRPAFGRGFIEGFVEFADVGFAVVGPLAVSVGVVDDEAEARTAARGRPLQHLQVAVGVAEGGDGAASYMALD